MALYEAALRRAAETPLYDEAAVRAAGEDVQVTGECWRTLQSRLPGWQGEAAGAAFAASRTFAKSDARNGDLLAAAVAAVSRANAARAAAERALRSLPSARLDPTIAAAIRAGSSLWLGPFGSLSGPGAVHVAEKLLATVRESAARAALDRLASELEEPAETVRQILEGLQFADGFEPPLIESVSRPPGNDTDPWMLGVQWLFGIGPREQHFTDGDPMTEMVKNDPFYRSQMGRILGLLREGKESEVERLGIVYSLGGVEGVAKYLGDYSTLFTGGTTGNLAFTFLGSHRAEVDVLARNPDGSWTVHVTIHNDSSLQSATRPPVIGYDPLYQRTIGGLVDTFSTATGIGRTTTQTIEWTERIGP